ncbi:hypothetical protein KC19_7G042400 [Ceratodon purpureus]|uniref:Uncharacterized protein n=1 Tax=Ceratodon purpureus TaxID=3225 RepID=A0A8T0H4H2_CERPU|nr:hypothetical protein KC19_7G042400 [Ceratodon purpureus]
MYQVTGRTIVLDLEEEKQNARAWSSRNATLKQSEQCMDGAVLLRCKLVPKQLMKFQIFLVVDISIEVCLHRNFNVMWVLKGLSGCEQWLNSIERSTESRFVCSHIPLEICNRCGTVTRVTCYTIVYI